MSASQAADSTRLISVTHYKQLFLFFLFTPGLGERFCKTILSRDGPVVQKQGKDGIKKKTIHWYLTVEQWWKRKTRILHYISACAPVSTCRVILHVFIPALFLYLLQLIAKQMAATQAVSSAVRVIYQETISDSTQDCEGQDSVLCQGPCQKWIHKTCAGLLIPAFKAIVKSKTPFHCFQCSLSAHATEIKDLLFQLSQLSKELAKMKLRLVESHLEDCPPPTSSAANVSSNAATHVPVINAAKLKEPFDVKERKRKFNFVVSGLPECPGSMPWKARVSKDEDALATDICKQALLVSSLSIRDCVQLGKYKANSRPRPILVTLNKAAEVTRVLSTYFPQDGIRAWPDLSPAARKIRALL